MSLLPEKVGSPLSLNAIGEDVGISYTAVKNCFSALQFAYGLFLVPPYSTRMSMNILQKKLDF